MANIPRSSSDPFRSVGAVTPNDNTPLPQISALYVGVSGDLSIVMADGTSAVLKNHPVGYVPGDVRQVKATGTTATNIVALF